VTSNAVTGLPAEDRLAIMELYARHAWAMDSGDTDAFVDVFAPDAVAYGDNRGHDELRAWHQKFLGDYGFPGSQHFVTQFRFLEGDDSRHAVQAYVVRFHRIPGTTSNQVLYQGFYHDVVAKIDGRWKFASKQAGAAEHVRAQEFQLVSPGWTQDTRAYELWDLGAHRSGQ
jgi:uncharacterized protein (TIGR02246 family)